ncbi:Putative AC transposase [Dendrobium catenatum]|uniref:AC transposase n=1 Tax=Dendrobium catenatum TaxID=906689 RepID=A0A2I0VH45_9ASPA|nr:Putative AC transposase [Dendrobium catenatum]
MTSVVWGHYEMLPNTSDGKQKCKCKKCGTTYLCDSKNGTGNLRRHLENCKKRNMRDIGQLILQTNTESFDHAEFRDLFTASIIMHDLPFQCVEWVGLRAVLLYLRRDLQLISRNTARNDCKKLFLKEKCNLMEQLSKVTSRICLTSDLWTSINTDGFICLTAHYIDNDWHLQKKIITFSFMPPPHDGISLFEQLQLLLVEWKIENKLFSITLDNASANNSCVDYLKNHLNLRDALIMEGAFFHIRCTAHIINLVVQEGLKDIDSATGKIRESIKYVKGSQARKQKFLDCASQSCLDGRRGLRQDVPTRWNSTFLMLDSAIYFKRAFQHLELVDSNYKTCPTSMEWEKAEEICKFLEPFHEITCLISGSKYPTANLYFPCISTAYAELKNVLLSSHQSLKKMAAGMIVKFEKYWSEFSDILAVAVILDPRYKMAFVEWCYQKLYAGNSNSELRKLKLKLISLCANYNPRKSELDIYLEEPKIDSSIDLDILKFWQGNQYRFPSLSAMARDILCIPITTVASESAFSNIHGFKIISI